MIYFGRGIEVTPGVAVGFDEHGEAVISGGSPEAPIDPRKILDSAYAARELRLRDAALLTAWIEAATTPPKSSIIVAPAGAVPVNGHAGPRRIR